MYTTSTIIGIVTGYIYMFDNVHSHLYMVMGTIFTLTMASWDALILFLGYGVKRISITMGVLQYYAVAFTNVVFEVRHTRTYVGCKQSKCL